jgi:AraC-like DNA-binding protein
VDAYRTTLSVKSVLSGSAFYRTARGHFRIEPDNFLVLNEGQTYSLEIAPGTGTQTLCPFFQPGLLGHVAAAAATPGALDDLEPAGGVVDFCERLYPKTDGMGRRLAQIAAGLRSPAACGPWLEDQLFALAEELLALRGHVRREMASFPGLRPATREELYRRLHRARDYVDSCYPQALDVSAVARVACLSPYHFQRMFRAAFGQTPMQYLQDRRLRAARRLVSDTDLPVTAVCFEVGFESLGSFSWLFRRRFGTSPRAFRAAGRR